MPAIAERTVISGKKDIDFPLKRVFGKDSFRPPQRDVIEAALQGHDVFLQAATGFGKSLCFQLPAVVDHGLTVVISPLLALMNNQVTSLRAAHIPVATINSQTPMAEKKAILDDLRSGHPRTRLLYVTPEYCTMDHFRKNLRVVHGQRELARITIDEAHCISEWGHDFRTAFKELTFFKREFPDVPMICCTATATAQVRNDIIDTLGLNRLTLRCFTMTTSRPNLHFEIRYTSDEEDRYDDFLVWLRGVYERRTKDVKRANERRERNERATNVSGIIYTLFRKDTEALAARLQDDGIGAKPYHAGLSTEQKHDHLRGWVENREGYDIIVATTAFGMGIDKDNVRFVVHWQLPKSFEGYYQEAGRAGRDRKASICILYYSREDRDRATQLIIRDQERKRESCGGMDVRGHKVMVRRSQSFQALVSYCEKVNACRHHLIAQYFGEEDKPPCEWACDWHKDARALMKRREAGLASEEWCMTQRQSGAYAYDCYD